jgi:hypothetical protein
MSLHELDDKKVYNHVTLHGDGPQMGLALKTTAQAGVCALEIFREIFPARFELLGISEAILILRREL